MCDGPSIRRHMSRLRAHPQFQRLMRRRKLTSCFWAISLWRMRCMFFRARMIPGLRARGREPPRVSRDFPRASGLVDQAIGQRLPSLE